MAKRSWSPLARGAVGKVTPMNGPRHRRATIRGWASDLEGVAHRRDPARTNFRGEAHLAANPGPRR